MASTLTHLSVVVLSHLWPAYFNFSALVISSLLADMEAPVMYIKAFIKKKKLIGSYLDTQQGFLHTLLGNAFIVVPASAALTYLWTREFSVAVSISCIVGAMSHLLLDIPGHRKLVLFYPRIFDNPFLLSLRIPFIEKLYPWHKYEKAKGQVMPEFSWWVVSHVFVLIAAIIYILT
ncbi:MAG: metal-dependent hydrolase [archaeon]